MNTPRWLIAMLLIACLQTVSVVAAETTIVQITDTIKEPTVTPSDAAEAEPFIEEEHDEFFDEVEEVEVHDPFEGFNRGVFWFNDKLYFYLLKPIAKGLRFLPETARIGIKNFFSNLAMPVRASNALLQLKFEDAGSVIVRFIVNSTLGIGGLGDYAKHHFGMRQKNEDFGQTLGHWGVGPGPFLVLPILGSSNIRDGISLIPDAYISPTRWLLSDGDLAIAAALWTLEATNKLSLDKDTYEAIKKEQLDPYAFMRDAFMQRRAKLVAK